MINFLKFLLIALFGGLWILIFEKFLYKFIILILASLNEDAKYDDIKRSRIIDLAKRDKTWFLVAMELDLFYKDNKDLRKLRKVIINDRYK